MRWPARNSAVEPHTHTLSSIAGAGYCRFELSVDAFGAVLTGRSFPGELTAVMDEEAHPAGKFVLLHWHHLHQEFFLEHCPGQIKAFGRVGILNVDEGGLRCRTALSLEPSQQVTCARVAEAWSCFALIFVPVCRFCALTFYKDPETEDRVGVACEKVNNRR